MNPIHPHSSKRRLATAALVAAITAAAAAAPAWAALPSALPSAVQSYGKVDYLSGGIGAENAAAMEAEARHWPLTLEFAARDKPRNDWLADVAVRVRDQRGHTVLKAQSQGPFLLARLKPGRYDVEATFVGKTLHETVQIRPGHPVRSVLMWPHAWAYRGA